MSWWKYPYPKGLYKQYKEFKKSFEFSHREWTKLYNGINPELNEIGHYPKRFSRRIKRAVNNQIRFKRRYNHKGVAEVC